MRLNTIKHCLVTKHVEVFFVPVQLGAWGPGVPGGRTSSPVLENFVIFRQNFDDSDKSTRKNSPIGNQGDAFTLLPMTFALLKRRYSALDKLYIVEMFIVENHNSFPQQINNNFPQQNNDKKSNQTKTKSFVFVA